MQPGDVYVFDLPTDVNDFWLMVREHPEGSGLILLVPVDDTPLRGACDVPVNVFGHNQATAYARCGLSIWCETTDLTRHKPARILRHLDDNTPAKTSEAELTAVRKMLADLARGNRLPTSPDDSNPEYWELTYQLERMGHILSGGRM